MINIIVAMAENRVIGNNGRIPWNFPEDRRYFKNITTGNIIIMGRKTFEEIGYPLPERYNILISSNKIFTGDNIIALPDFDSAIYTAREYAEKNNIEIFLCGGEKIYRQGLAIADRLYITKIHSAYEGDVFFPEYNEDAFVLTGRTESSGLSFCVYDRKGGTL